MLIWPLECKQSSTWWLLQDPCLPLFEVVIQYLVQILRRSQSLWARNLEACADSHTPSIHVRKRAKAEVACQMARQEAEKKTQEAAQKAHEAAKKAQEAGDNAQEAANKAQGEG